MTFLILKTDWAESIVPEQITINDIENIEQELQALQDIGHITIIDDYIKQ